MLVQGWTAQAVHSIHAWMVKQHYKGGSTVKKSSAFVPVILLVLLSLVVTACGGTKTTGDTSLDNVKKAGVLKIAIDATYPPMEFIDTDGKTPVGFDVEYGQALAAKMGLKAEFVVSDWNGILGGLKGKRYDAIISSMTITPEREKEVSFLEYAKMSQVFVSRAGVKVTSEKDLAGKIVAVQADTTSQEWVEKVRKENVKDIKDVVSFPTGTDTFLDLKNKRADVIVADEPVGLFYANKDAATYTVTGRAMDPEPVGVALRKEDAALKAAIDKAHKDLVADGTYEKISKKWFGKTLGN